MSHKVVDIGVAWITTREFIDIWLTLNDVAQKRKLHMDAPALPCEKEAST